jgi:hypothetical protein
MFPMHTFLQNLSSFTLGCINEEVALQVFEYHGIIGKKTDVIICVCGSAMVVKKRGYAILDFLIGLLF